jgi:hypothetical protein
VGHPPGIHQQDLELGLQHIKNRFQYTPVNFLATCVTPSALSASAVVISSRVVVPR